MAGGVMIIAAFTLAAALTVSAAEPPRVGQQAPDFTLVDQNGKRVSLSAARGHKVVLVFYRGYW
jgi:cytochrome oxidase Cu insertion factor (SCO1/SenC/PrrC family)